MTASDHARAIFETTGRGLFDRMLINTGQANRLLPLYERDGAFQVSADLEAVRSFGYIPLTGDFVSEGHQVRHDTNKLAAALFKLLDERSERYGLNALLGTAARRTSPIGR